MERVEIQWVRVESHRIEEGGQSGELGGGLSRLRTVRACAYAATPNSTATCASSSAVLPNVTATCFFILRRTETPVRIYK